jgi:hypothetical protein
MCLLLQHLSVAFKRINGRYIVLLLLLFAAHTLFLWMFIASEGLEQMAEADRISGPQGFDVRAAAYDFAARWRHGMSGRWLLYMPGFFVTAIATWFWSTGRTFRGLLMEAIIIMTLALLGAELLAPAGTAYIVEEFQSQTGLKCHGVSPGSSIVGMAAGLYTLVTWSVFIIASQRALARRSLKPMWVPAVLGLGLGLVREMTVDDFTGLWAQRVLHKDGVAIFSLLLIPILAAFLVWCQLRSDSPQKDTK